MLTNLKSFFEMETTGFSDGVDTVYALWKSLNPENETCSECVWPASVRDALEITTCHSFLVQVTSTGMQLRQHFRFRLE